MNANKIKRIMHKGKRVKKIMHKGNKIWEEKAFEWFRFEKEDMETDSRFEYKSSQLRIKIPIAEKEVLIMLYVEGAISHTLVPEELDRYNSKRVQQYSNSVSGMIFRSYPQPEKFLIVINRSQNTPYYLFWGDEKQIYNAPEFLNACKELAKPKLPPKPPKPGNHIQDPGGY